MFMQFCHFGDWFVATNRGNNLESILLREPGLHFFEQLCVMPYGGILTDDVFCSDVDGGEELCPETFNTMKMNK